MMMMDKLNRHKTYKRLNRHNRHKSLYRCFMNDVRSYLSIFQCKLDTNKFSPPPKKNTTYCVNFIENFRNLSWSVEGRAACYSDREATISTASVRFLACIIHSQLIAESMSRVVSKLVSM